MSNIIISGMKIIEYKMIIQSGDCTRIDYAYSFVFLLIK